MGIKLDEIMKNANKRAKEEILTQGLNESKWTEHGISIENVTIAVTKEMTAIHKKTVISARTVVQRWRVNKGR